MKSCRSCGGWGTDKRTDCPYRAMLLSCLALNEVGTNKRSDCWRPEGAVFIWEEVDIC